MMMIADMPFVQNEYESFRLLPEIQRHTEWCPFQNSIFFFFFLFLSFFYFS